MPTRFYLPRSLTAPVSPAFDAGWEVTAEAERRLASTMKLSETTLYSLYAETSAVPVDVLGRQYISEPLRPQVIGGTLKGSIASRDPSANAQARAQLLVKVVSNDGLTVRGVLIPMDDGPLSHQFVSSSFFNTRHFPLGWTDPGTALSPLTAQDGDRLVFEIGYRAHNTTADSRSISLLWGAGDSFPDAPEPEGSLFGNGWLEFSQHLLLQQNPVVQIQAQLVGSLSIQGKRVTTINLSAELKATVQLEGEIDG